MDWLAAVAILAIIFLSVVVLHMNQEIKELKRTAEEAHNKAEWLDFKFRFFLKIR